MSTENIESEAMPDEIEGAAAVAESPSAPAVPVLMKVRFIKKEDSPNLQLKLLVSMISDIAVNADNEHIVLSASPSALRSPSGMVIQFSSSAQSARFRTRVKEYLNPAVVASLRLVASKVKAN